MSVCLSRGKGRRGASGNRNGKRRHGWVGMRKGPAWWGWAARDKDKERPNFPTRQKGAIGAMASHSNFPSRSSVTPHGLDCVYREPVSPRIAASCFSCI
ncbi:hypothetical protein IG631_05414 [Alternaria alternata]|nr:hypothetical protein IG631_05414 [Alternaria alternata]